MMWAVIYCHYIYICIDTFEMYGEYTSLLQLEFVNRRLPRVLKNRCDFTVKQWTNEREVNISKKYKFGTLQKRIKPILRLLRLQLTCQTELKT